VFDLNLSKEVWEETRWVLESMRDNHLDLRLRGLRRDEVMNGLRSGLVDLLRRDW
jgi:hypothetical protein